MREILFCGKTFDNRWVEGLLIWIDCDDEIALIREIGKAGVSYYDFLVEFETVGQFTGLTDKNGKKIFEGDILEVHDESPLFDGYDSEELQFNGKVLFEEDTGMYVCKNSEQGNAFCNMNLSKCKVIGNVYDNPELLEVGE